MAFNIEAARKDGISDADIANHLAGIHRFNVDAARADGVSDAEIADHLAQKSTTFAAVKNAASDFVSSDQSPSKPKNRTWIESATDMAATGISAINAVRNGITKAPRLIADVYNDAQNEKTTGLSKMDMPERMRLGKRHLIYR